MPVKKRTLLESLSKAALVEFARGWDVPGFSTMSKPELVDALAGMRSLPLADVLGQLSRDELKAACEAEGLDTSGREKSVLIERLLGQAGEGDGAGGGREKFALKSEPSAAPKLGFGAKERKSAAVGSPAPKGGGGKAPGKGANKRAIEQYEHTAAERLNNPPVGLVTPESDPLTPAPGTKARKQYQYDPNLDPTLQWAGKAERLSFEVETVSLHVHERIDPKTILEAVQAKNGKPNGGGEEQMGLFAKPRENPPLREAIDFYKHPHGWSNRLIAGDSLLVMNSLLEKEAMAGKVQMVYFDPPYGIKYGSNFQPFTNKRDVKDRSDGDLTREPEMLKAFRDTWELGVHSYLTYIRDRVLLAKELLAESGSCIMQIGDENLHIVRNVMDEVFGPDNFVALVTFSKTSSATTELLAGVSDYLLWFARDISKVKYRQLFLEKVIGETGASKYRSALLPDGSDRPMTQEEVDDPSLLPAKARVFTTGGLTSQRPPGDFPVNFDGRDYRPGTGYWKTGEEGMRRLIQARRVVVSGNRLRYVRFFEDFPAYPITNLWTDIGGIQSRADPKVYVVQTATTAVARCVLMTTDPSDVVLDITCGSGTTAVVAEQWGRRWITCDTSRVAITLAKQRLMQQDFDYYTLRYPEQGVTGGFEYETVPHVTLKSIANNPEIKEGMSREAIDRAITKYAEQESLYDKPNADTSRVRVTGPFTVEAVPAPVVKPVADLAVDTDAVAREQGEADSSIARDGETLRQAQWRSELLKTGARGEGGMMLGFTRVEPLAGARYLHALAETRDKGGFRKATWKAGDAVAICFGPEHAPLEQRTVELAWAEARELKPRPAVLLFAAFAFDPEAQKDIDEMDAAKAGMLFLRAGMNDDLATEDLKKKRSSNESFWLIGQPEIALRRLGGGAGADAGKYAVEVQGFDYFDPKKGTIESGGTDRIAMWMLDTDYDGRSVFPRQVFFPMAGAKDGWARLGATLRAEIDQEKIEAYRGVKSLPFEAGKFGRIAVKIVDDRGIESLVVRGLDEAEGATKPGAKK